MEILRLKYQQNRIINEEFDFWRGGRDESRISLIHIFQSKLLLKLIKRNNY